MIYEAAVAPSEPMVAWCRWTMGTCRPLFVWKPFQILFLTVIKRTLRAHTRLLFYACVCVRHIKLKSEARSWRRRRKTLLDSTLHSREKNKIAVETCDVSTNKQTIVFIVFQSRRCKYSYRMPFIQFNWFRLLFFFFRFPRTFSTFAFVHVFTLLLCTHRRANANCNGAFGLTPNTCWRHPNEPYTHTYEFVVNISENFSVEPYFPRRQPFVQQPA